MKNQPKLKHPPRPLLSCGIFGHCTQTVISPTTPSTHVLFPTPPPPPPPPPQKESPPSSSSSSSTTTSQSFTQWKFPLPNPPLLHSPPRPETNPSPELQPPTSTPPPPPPPPVSDLAELFHLAELQFASDSDDAKVDAIRLLEQSLVPNPLPTTVTAAACPAAVMGGVVGFLKQPALAKTAVKVLLAVCLAEENRRQAVEAGAVSAVVEAMAGLSGATVERALAAMELLCTVAEGVAELRCHALAVPLLLELLTKMTGRGAEYAMSVLAAVYGGGGDGIGESAPPPPGQVAQIVLLVLQGECSARARRKGVQLLKALQESDGLNLVVGG